MLPRQIFVHWIGLVFRSDAIHAEARPTRLRLEIEFPALVKEAATGFQKRARRLSGRVTIAETIPISLN